MEPRRLSRRRARPLRRLPYAAQRARRRGAGPPLRRRRGGRLARLCDRRDLAGPVPWDRDSLAFYLRHGWHELHGVSRGPMAEVTGNLGPLPDADIDAIATYVASVMGEPSAERRQQAEALAGAGRRAGRSDAVAGGGQPGRRPTPMRRGRAARRSMRAPARPATTAGRPLPFGGLDFALSTAVNAPNPQNIVNVTLFGLPAADGEASSIMPGFAGVLDDDADGGAARLHARALHRRAALGRTWRSSCARRAAASTRSASGRRTASRGRLPMWARRTETMAVTLNVNGSAHEIDADPATPLLYVLRNDLALNGAKFGCGLGQCGSCTVMVDGEAVFSCVTPILLLEGREITTVEGLGTIEEPGPMQAAFIEEQAAQCGYCIPGMMMRAQALLQKNPARERRRDPRGARAQSLPLRHAHAHPDGGAAGRRADAVRRRLPTRGEGRVMTHARQRPHLPPQRARRHRRAGRQLLAARRALAQQQAPAAAAAPEPPKLPGSLDDAPLPRRLDPDRRRRQHHRLHRQGGARPGHQDRAPPGRGRGAGGRARRHRADHRRHRPDARRGLHRRQPVHAEQRHGDPPRRRAGARDPDRRGGAPLRRRARPSCRAEGKAVVGARRPIGRLRRAGRRGASPRRGAAAIEAEAARDASASWASRCRASTFPPR